MDTDLLRMVASTASRTRVELGNLVPLLKAHCSPDEYEPMARTIAAAIAHIGLVIDQSLKDNAALEKEFQDRANKFDRSYL